MCHAFPQVSFCVPRRHVSSNSQSALRSSPGDSSLDYNRRSLFVSGAAWCLLNTVTPTPALADASDVRAPLELLLPATRVKNYIDQAVDLCRSIPQTDTINGNNNNLADGILRLQHLLENEPSFMTTEEEKLSKRYLEIKTSAAWQQARQKEREARGAELGIDYTAPYDKFNTAIQQWGENRQFKILRSRQRQLEQSSTIRTALNAYTNNLVFGDAYKLNVEGEEKKALVRNDALPSVNAVVVSDLDLRDLYRNQVLQNMEDAKAEIEYQLKLGDWNVEEILTCLIQAQSYCQEWFNPIPKRDVDEARTAVSKET